jgi:hypothetical protein
VSGAIRFTLDALPGLTFGAVPLTSPPGAGAVVFLYAEHLMTAVAEYEGGGVWNIVHEQFPGLVPTHWVRASTGGEVER